jgi:hypothetical protein
MTKRFRDAHDPEDPGAPVSVAATAAVLAEVVAAETAEVVRRSKYVGVRPAKHGKPGWIAVINSSHEGKRIRREFGPFAGEEEAARKYDEEAALFRWSNGEIPLSA